MKKFYMVLTGLIVLVSACILEADEKNIVPNPGFEEMNGGNPAEWGSLQKNWTIDREVAHSGKNSLRIMNNDPNCYTLTTCTVRPEPGESYDISAWVKLQGVIGNGATFMVEFWGDGGKYIGGTWDAPSLCGTADWQKLVFKNRIMPKDTTINTITLSIFLSRGSTGTVWFDDIGMHKAELELFETFLLYPNYRGWMLPINKKKEIEVDISMNLVELKKKLQDMEICAILRKTHSGTMIVKDSETIKEKKWSPLPSEKFIAKLDAADIPDGEYELLVILRDNTADKIIDMDAYKLKKFSMEEFSRLKTYFDENCVFYVEGKPYFPLGFYTYSEWNDGNGYLKYCNPAEIASDGPFNTVIFYAPLWKEMLDGIYSKGLRIFGGQPVGPFNHGKKRLDPAVRHGEEMEIKNMILKFKNHPAVIGWYINDEVPTDDTCYPTLIDHYRWVTETDPDHPTYAVHMNLGDLKHGAFVSDILGVDPYPIGVQDLTWVCDMTEEALEAGHGTRPVWTVVQALMEGVSYAEGRCVTYLAIVSGTKGLFYFCFPDLKISHISKKPLPDFEKRLKQQKLIAGEIAALSPVILSAEDTGKVKVLCNDKDLRFLLKKHEGKYYLLSVNSKNEKKKARFEITGIDIVNIADYFKKGTAIPVKENAFAHEYEPYGAYTYVITPRQ